MWLDFRGDAGARNINLGVFIIYEIIQGVKTDIGKKKFQN